MNITSLTKLIVCVLVILASTLLCALGKMPYAETGILISGALGYVFGNGHGIMSAKNNGLISRRD